MLIISNGVRKITIYITGIEQRKYPKQDEERTRKKVAKMSDNLLHIGMVAFLLIVASVIYCCLAMSGEQWRLSDKEWEEYERRENKNEE